MISAGEPSAPSLRWRPVAVIAIVALLVAGAVLLVIAAAHVTPNGYAPGPARAGDIGAGVPLPTPTLPSQPPRHPQRTTSSLGSVALLALVGLCLAIAAAVVSVIVQTVRVPRLRRRERAASRLAAEAMFGVTEQLAAAVESGIDELAAERPARDSIIACWQRVRAAASDAGITPVASDTPEQAINRVLAASGARAEPLEALAELYREARFSRHVMGAAAVATARDALDAILVDLRQGASADV
jgi:Zn-dependent protease with chaperone function